MPTIAFNNEFDIEKLHDEVSEGQGSEGDNEDVNQSTENPSLAKKEPLESEKEVLDMSIFEDDVSDEVEDSELKDPLESNDEVEDEVEDSEDVAESESESESEDPQPKVQRDLEALKNLLGDDYDVEKFKQTSNDAYSVIEKIVTDYATERSRIETLNSEIETQKTSLKNAGVLPDSYLQHEQGFILDKKYLSSAQEVANADAVINHWQQQLQAINADEQWHGIEVNPATQQQQVSITPSEPSPTASAQVQQALTNALALKAQAQQNVNSIQQEFQARRSNYETELKGLQSKYFSWHREQDGDKKKFAISTGDEYSVSDIKSSFKQELPDSFKANVPTDLAADMYVTIQNYAYHIKTLQKELNKTKHLKTEKKLIGKKVGKKGSVIPKKSTRNSQNSQPGRVLDYSQFE